MTYRCIVLNDQLGKNLMRELSRDALSASFIGTVWQELELMLMYAYISINKVKPVMPESQELVEAKRNFYRNHHYSKERMINDYLNETSSYSNDQWSAPQRAARLSAVVKRYKTSQMLVFIFEVGGDIELDLTPLTVKRLCKALFVRTGSQDVIVDTFGQKGRNHRSSSSAQSTIDEISARYMNSAQGFWAVVLKDIVEAKLLYKGKVKALRAESST